MEVFFLLAGISFTISSISSILYFVFLWQLREYRLDRMIAHLKTPIGSKLLVGRKEWVKWILFLISVISYPVLWISWVGEIYRIFSRKQPLRLPVFTYKAILLIIFSSFILIGVPLFTGSWREFLFMSSVMDRVSFAIVAFFVSILSIVTRLWRLIIFYRARKARMKYSSIRVVGITGSFGKTTTKEYIYHLLRNTYRVKSTKESKNSDIAIADFLIHEINADTEVAVIEMGILKQGELSQICNMSQPDIGVITGIGNQHVELFGSRYGIQKAKFELIESLPKNGIAIFNGRNEGAIEMALWAKKRNVQSIVTSIDEVKGWKDHVSFLYRHGSDSYTVKANLIGVQTIPNLALAIETALVLGLKMKDIQERIACLGPVKETMYPQVDGNGRLWIDDTFNASVDGVMAAISYMKLYKGKKILVLTPLIELGNEAKEAHKRIASFASEVCDIIILTNRNFSSEFSHISKQHNCKVVDQLSRVNKIIDEVKDPDSVIVCEGKEAKRILAYAGKMTPYVPTITRTRDVSKRRS